MTRSAAAGRGLAVLSNVLAPYRLPIYEQLARHFDVTVLYSGVEANRSQWPGTTASRSAIRFKRAWGVTLPRRRREASVKIQTFIHVNPGLWVDLLALKPEAVITSEMGFRTLVALLYGWWFEKPVWVWWGGTVHTERAISPAKRAFRRWLVRRVPGWFTYGDTSTEYLLTMGAAPHAITQLQNCIPEEPYLAPVAPLARFDPRPVVLCVGQFIARKGLPLLIDAAARLQGEGLRFSLVLVGDGPDKAAIQAQAQALRLRDVHFCEAVPPDRMPAVYRSGDVLVFPTLLDNWGLVVNEAMWSGLPALVSKYAGCARELVPVECTFDPLDADDFTGKLRRAVGGCLPPPDVGRLKRLADVSDLMARTVNAALDRA